MRNRVKWLFLLRLSLVFVVASENQAFNKETLTKQTNIFVCTQLLGKGEWGILCPYHFDKLLFMFCCCFKFSIKPRTLAVG